MKRGAVGIEQRAPVAVPRLAFLRRARQVRVNATAAIACTATLRSVHADPVPRPLHIEKSLALLPGLHAKEPRELPSCHMPHDSGPLQWARGSSGAKAPPLAACQCGIISENTKTIMLRILYHLKLASTHVLMPESRRADLLPSTPLTGTAIDSPWVTTSSNTNFPHTTRKKRH